MESSLTKEAAANQNNQWLYENIEKMTDQEKRAYGSILGAFIGDAMGAYLEFKKSVKN